MDFALIILGVVLFGWVYNSRPKWRPVMLLVFISILIVYVFFYYDAPHPASLSDFDAF